MVERDGVREVSDNEMTRSRLKRAIPVVCSEVEGRKKRQELRSKMISRFVKVNIEVAGYYKFVRSGGSKR